MNHIETLPAAPTATAAARRMQDLRRVELFSRMDDRELRELAESLWERACDAGETVVHADTPAGTHLFIVAEGEVAITLANEDGKEAVVNLLGSGEFFGEMSLFDQEPRAATVRATAPTRLLLFRREDFQARLHRSPALSTALVETLIRRIRSGNRRVANLARRPVEARIAEALLSLVDERGRRIKDDTGIMVLVPNRPTQQFIADIAGTTRESVSRALSQWSRLGLLAVRGRDWLVREEDRLRALAV
jgi:CRP/FNR family cyclic AMP-dependent transcriptional regulator